eukprot:3944363-Amphidinium_carterae.1
MLESSVEEGDPIEGRLDSDYDYFRLMAGWTPPPTTDAIYVQDLNFGESVTPNLHLLAQSIGPYGEEEDLGLEIHLTPQVAFLLDIINDRELQADPVTPLTILTVKDIQRNAGANNHNLSREEIRDNAEAVKAAILAELQRWTGLNSFERAPRATARNILESIYVLTWKRGAQQPDGTFKRQSKCRICVRGFQDAEAMDLDTYSGTTTKWGQRLVCSVAAQAGWSMCSYDISCAFLKGTSFSEIEASGGMKRTVFMDLPAGGHTLLRLIPGFE